jgi:hypothetical protein
VPIRVRIGDNWILPGERVFSRAYYAKRGICVGKTQTQAAKILAGIPDLRFLQRLRNVTERDNMEPSKNPVGNAISFSIPFI